jgi:hypothetical protein
MSMQQGQQRHNAAFAAVALNAEAKAAYGKRFAELPDALRDKLLPREIRRPASVL